MPFIPLEVFANNPSTTVSSGGTSAPAGGTVETWTVASSASFPAVEIGATQFHVADPAPGMSGEIITVRNISGTTWTVVRGAEGSITAAHAAGFTVVQVVTAGVLAGAQYYPWQFPVQAYNAQGDGKIGAGGTGASGQAVLTDAAANFVNAAAPAGDVGKCIIVNQGTGSSTAATNPFVGTITAVNSATSITLSGNLAATCTAAPYIYGTDDTAAVNAAVLAAAQWAVATGNYKVQVLFEPQNYMLGTLVQSTTYQWAPFNTGANYTYNTHIPVPFATQYDRKLTIDFIGTGDAGQPYFWGSAVPGLNGTCLVSAVFPPAQPDATFGQMSVIGTPATMANIGTGGISGAGFANVLADVDGITIVTPFNAQQYGLDFRFASAVNIIRGAATAFAPVNWNAQAAGGTWLSSNNLPANGVAAGLAMPLMGSNANCNIGYFAAEGLATGLIISEYLNAQRVATVNCFTGIAVDAISPRNAMHGASILYWWCGGCHTGLYCSLGTIAQYPLFVGNANFELMIFYYVDDANGALTGTLNWYTLSQTTLITPVSNNGATHLNIVNLRMFPGIWAADAGRGLPAPAAAPASATAQQNTAFRPATVYASATTGITNTGVGPASGSLTALGQTAGNNQAIPVRVPSGYWYSVTYTGTLTVTWVLE